jgi:hypothetical protein
MKTLKKIAIGLALLLVVLLIVAAILPKNYTVSRSITVDRPKPLVFEKLRSLAFQKEWSVWSQLDPNAQMSFKGVDGEVGFVWYWNGNDDMGEGEQELISISDDRIEMELRFIRPFNMRSQTYYNVDAINDKQTGVEWVINGSFPYPFNLFLPLFGMDNSIGKDFEQGLSEFKRLVEQMPINSNEAQTMAPNI